MKNAMILAVSFLVFRQAHAQEVQMFTVGDDIEVRTVRSESLGARNVSIKAPSAEFKDSYARFVQFDSREYLASFLSRFSVPMDPGADAGRGCVAVSNKRFCIGDRYSYDRLQGKIVSVLPRRLSDSTRDLVHLDKRSSNLVVFQDDQGRFLLTTAQDILELKSFLDSGELKHVEGSCKAEHYLMVLPRESQAKACAQKDALETAERLCQAGRMSLDRESVVVLEPPKMTYSEAFNESFSTSIKASCRPLPGEAGQSAVPDHTVAKRGEKCPDGYFRSVEDLSYTSECLLSAASSSRSQSQGAPTAR